jgi:hypothetical protein
VRSLAALVLLIVLCWLIVVALGDCAAQAAPASTIRCQGGECLGTNQPERMIGATTADFLFANAGDDLVRGRGGADILDAGKGADQVVGGSGRDKVYLGSGDDWGDFQDGRKDTIYCGPGIDEVQIDLIPGTLKPLDELHGCEWKESAA